MSRDRSVSSDLLAGHMGAAGKGGDDYVKIRGVFRAVCRDKRNNILWEDEFENLLTTLGKNFLLDTTLAGSAYTVVGPYMGLISSTSFSAVAAADTMASHAGWLEAGSTNAPTFAARLTCAWSSASAGTKALSAGLTFTFTGAGTVQGAFIVTGSGAVTTLMSTAGTLYAEGVLGTPQPVVSTNTLTLSYSTTLT
jgi:hypothetical protein